MLTRPESQQGTNILIITLKIYVLYIYIYLYLIYYVSTGLDWNRFAATESPAAVSFPGIRIVLQIVAINRENNKNVSYLCSPGPLTLTVDLESARH